MGTIPSHILWTQRQLAWTEIAKIKYGWRQRRDTYVQRLLHRLYTRTRKRTAQDISTEESDEESRESDDNEDYL